MTAEVNCPECQSRRSDPLVVCPTCGAPPIREGDQRGADEEVRTHDLEPYVTLRYIAKLFKVLAVLMVIEVGLMLRYIRKGADPFEELRRLAEPTTTATTS